MTARPVGSTIVRLAEPELTGLLSLLFRRYPRYEWATFSRFGWRKTASGGLVLTLAGLDAPSPGDLDERVGHVAISEPYTLRAALTAEKHPLAVGVIHSHPDDCAPVASSIDDDMDGYYSDYFRGFAPNRPYVSLIVSKIGDQLIASGRVYFEGRWLAIDRFAAAPTPVTTWVCGRPVADQGQWRERTRRLSDAFGEVAAARLRLATAAVVGAGGTGSAAIETLARAGVGRLIIVDPDRLEESNLERVHGSRPEHAAKHVQKAALAREHVLSIDPAVRVEAYVGALPQAAVVDAIASADVAVGCTDSQHSRLALSDLALRYLVPAIDCGVLIEGADGRVTGQAAQFVRFLPADPCALCRGMIVPGRLAQELMSEAERKQRQQAADVAQAGGADGGAYWLNEPQLNTVGYLTTAVGAMAAGYAIGWLTGRFGTPFTRLQMNLVARYFDITDFDQTARPECVCRVVRGSADQGAADALITPPAHWPPVKKL